MYAVSTRIDLQLSKIGIEFTDLMSNKAKFTVRKVGCVDDPAAKVVRVVHISDTHMRHDSYLPLIPDGDILIHSGDFSAFSVKRYLNFTNRAHDRNHVIHQLDSFFEKLPHKHKIFVAGNHEISFTSKSKKYVENQLKNVTYLQDSSVTVEGINIYGSPWNRKRWTSYARGFAVDDGSMQHYWGSIPTETDILVTHMPPLGILDQATKKWKAWKNLFSPLEGMCEVCGDEHADFEHWGCEELKEEVLNRVRPALHLFGHVHESTGVVTADGITFSNAAMKIHETINVFDYYHKADIRTGEKTEVRLLSGL